MDTISFIIGCIGGYILGALLIILHGWYEDKKRRDK